MIAIELSLAIVVVAIRISSVRWPQHLPSNAKSGPHRPCVALPFKQHD